MVVNKGKEYLSELAREYEKANEAGINIAEAQMVLREEDKYDKELFKQKVKKKHREEKLKLKQKKRQDKEERNSSASSNDEDSDDDDPDLSWLPDPDKWCRKDSSDSREDHSESVNTETEETSEPSRRTVEWKM